MILQPLVENAVRYGVAVTKRPVTVTVAARAESGQLVLTVEDDGAEQGSKPTHSAEGGFGIGLANVRDRLAARFGETASIVSGPRAGLRLARGDSPATAW